MVSDPDSDEADNECDLSNAGSLLSINIRPSRAQATALKARTRGEQLVESWRNVKTRRGSVERSDLSREAAPDIWGACFELEPDYATRTLRIARIGRIAEAYDGGSRGASPALGEASSEIAAMLVDWLRALATESFRKGTALVEEERFMTRRGHHRYGCAVAPLTNARAVPIAVLGLIEFLGATPSR